MRFASEEEVQRVLSAENDYQVLQVRVQSSAETFLFLNLSSTLSLIR